MSLVLPEPVEILCREWSFSPTEELPGGHCSRVFADRTRVLKWPFQGEEQTSGAIAAEKLQASGGPQIFNRDRESGSILMERLRPGTPLAEVDFEDPECQEIFVRIVAQFQTIDPSGGMTMSEFYPDIDELRDELIASSPAEVFLHGDLHHGNLLLDQDQWRPIDPKGLRGDPHYEPVAFLRNPGRTLNQVEDLFSFTRERLLRMSSAMDLDPWRVAAWSLIDRRRSPSPEGTTWHRLTTAFEKLESELRP